MQPWNNYATDECVAVRCRVNPPDIAYICSIIEGYEGLCVVSTLDQAQGLLHFYCTVEQRDTFMEFLRVLGGEIPVTLVEELRLNAKQMHEIEVQYGRQSPRKRNMPVAN